MNLWRMSDENIIKLGLKADDITEKICREASKGGEGVYKKDLYPLVFGIVLKNILTEL